MNIIPHSPLKATVSKPNLRSYSGLAGLPNALRETLLQRGLGDGALVLEAILMTKLRQGQSYTYRQVLDKLRVVGVMAGEGLIRRGLNSYLFRQMKRIKGRGRPELLYEIPMVDALMVEMCPASRFVRSDDVRAADLGSLKLYRQALHREFIRRCPGRYPRQWLGKRLGVGKRTMANYDRACGIAHEEEFHEYALGDFAEDVIENGRVGLQWLRAKFLTGQVRDFPLRVGIYHAYKLMAEIFLVTQLANRYWLENENERSRAGALAF